jgi:hypothetical protein
VFCIVYLVMICSTLYPAIIGEVTTIMASGHINSGEIDNETLDHTEEYVHANNLTPALSKRVRRFVEYTAGLLGPDNPIGDWLPDSLKSDIQLSMHGTTLSRIPLFDGAPAGFFRTLVGHLQLTNYLPNECAYVAGDPACSLFLIRYAHTQP